MIQLIRLIWTLAAILISTLGCADIEPIATAEQSLSADPGKCLVVTGQFQYGSRQLTCLSTFGAATVVGSFYATSVDPYDGSCALCCCGLHGEPIEAALNDRRVE